MSRALPRSLMVSVATTIFDMSLFAVCVAVLSGAGLTLIFARWACGALGALSNFVLNRKLAFPGSSRAGTASQQLKRYLMVATGAVTLATSIWWLLDLSTTLDPRLLHPLSAAVVWLLFTYPLLKKWVFAH